MTKFVSLYTTDSDENYENLSSHEEMTEMMQMLKRDEIP